MRNKVEKYIITLMNQLDPSGENTKRYKSLFKDMTDKDFDNFMKRIRDGEEQLYIQMANVKTNMNIEELFDVAKKRKVDMFSKVWMTDPVTEKKFLTPKKYFVSELPVRRMIQFIDAKRSIPDDDKIIDGMTGQVTGSSKSAGITGPEIHALSSKGLNRVLDEYVVIRGGHMEAHASFTQMLEDHGNVDLSNITITNASRTAQSAEAILVGMHLETDITSG